MGARPKIKLQLSPFDRSLEKCGLIGLVILWVVTILAYLHLPDIIPIHFNASGKSNNYGSKITLIFLATFGTIVYYGITILNRYPHIFNYIKKITEENAEQQYTYATCMLRILKISIVLIFNLIMLSSYLAGIGKTKELNPWFLPFILGLLIIPTIYYIIKAMAS